MKKKAVIAGVAGIAIAAGAYTYYQNPEILSQLTGDKPSQTKTAAAVEDYNQRIQNTPRENMRIECENEVDFANSFKAMKDKMPQADQEKLDAAFNAVVKRELARKPDIENNYCREFKGWSEAKFLEEAGK